MPHGVGILTPGSERPVVRDTVSVQTIFPSFHGRQPDSIGQLGFGAEDFLWIPMATHKQETPDN